MAFSLLSDSERQLVETSRKLFAKRSALMSLWQEIADNFYPERADFTVQRSLGEEFANHLNDSYPVMVRRDLGNAISTMLRPKAKDWGAMTVWGEEQLGNESHRWLEWAWARQRQAMYMRHTQFTKATKEGDHDFATFGQCAIHVRFNRSRTALLYRAAHLRDIAWSENDDGIIDTVFEKRKVFARDLLKTFRDVHPQLREKGEKNPLMEVNVQHMIVPASQYPDLKNRLDYAELWVDMDNEYVMERTPSRTLQYVIPRWQTVSSSQYAFSPATITALPDARLIQAMTLVLLEAGEKFINPPMIATQEAVRSDVSLYAGSITWVDADYDERLGDALRPISTDKSGIQYGLELTDRQKAQLRDAFYLNQVTGMPAMGKTMTAYEAAQHVENYIRQATPLFEPMEYEYNGGLCEETFSQLFWAGAFGGPFGVPAELRGRDIEFKFKSPLHDAMGREKGARIMELTSIMQPLLQLDSGVQVHLDIHSAFRDALEGMEVPAAWLRDEDDAAAMLEQQRQAAEMQQALAMAQEAGDAGQSLGKAGQEVQRAA